MKYRYLSHHQFRIGGGLLVLALILSACGSSAEVSPADITPIPVYTPWAADGEPAAPPAATATTPAEAPVATAIPPTATPASEPTAAPTAEPTATPLPTATAEPTATATATSLPSPTPVNPVTPAEATPEPTPIAAEIPTEAAAPTELAADGAAAAMAQLPAEMAAALERADPANGEQLTVANGCIACHSLVEGQVLVGPPWYNVANTAATRVAGEPAPVYLYQSIMEPNAHVVEGFTPDLMPKVYADTLSTEQIADIIAYMLSLTAE